MGAVAAILGGRIRPLVAARDAVGHHVTLALRAKDVIVDILFAIDLLARKAKTLDAAGIVEHDGVMIEDVPKFRAGADLSASQTDR